MSQTPRGGTVPSLNLDNFLDRKILNGRMLTSPRSIEVCRRNGIDASELLPKPYEYFMGGNLPVALVERRMEHANAKQKQKLDALRQERQELIASGWDPEDEYSVSRRSIRSNSYVDPSPGRLSAMHYSEMQRANYELRQLEREKHNDLKKMKMVAGMENAAMTKEERDNDVRMKGAQHWNAVLTTHEHAKEQELTQQCSKREKTALNEHKRETQRWKATTEREFEAKDKGHQRNEKFAKVNHRASSASLTSHQIRLAKLYEDEDRAERAQQKQLESKMKWNEIGAQRQAEIKAVQAKAEENEKNRRQHYHEVLNLEEQKFAETVSKQEEESVRIQQELATRHQHYNSVVTGAHRLSAAKKEALANKLANKDYQWSEYSNSKAFEKLLEIEDKRERHLDHVEEVNRLKRKRDYQRQKYFQLKAARNA